MDFNPPYAGYTFNEAGWLTDQTGSSGQDIHYDYFNNGYVHKIEDRALNSLSVYGYDNNGNRTYENYQDLRSTTGDPIIYQNATITYDNLNRMQTVTDSRFNIRYSYDANDNVRQVLANYKDPVTGSNKEQNFWYKYDSLNRFLVSMGQLNSNNEIVGGTTGVEVSYIAGNRATAKYGINALGGQASAEHTESYTYTADGYLETISNTVANVKTLIATRVNDALGRVKTYTTLDASGNATVTTTLYDNDNSVTRTEAGDIVTIYSYDSNGGLLRTDTTKKIAAGTVVAAGNSVYAFEWWDSAKQSTITTNSDPTLGAVRQGISTFGYDINGHIKSLSKPSNTNISENVTFVNNAQGMVMQRNDIVNGGLNRYRAYYYANGKTVGDLSNDGPSREDYVQSLASSRIVQDPKSWKPISSADFDQNFEPITGSYPSQAPGSYTVNSSSETLRSIASSLWGDDAMWYLLADANGLTGVETLDAGQVLIVPDKVTNFHNNSRTFRPYNPGEALGNIMPNLPDAPPPPPPRKKKSSWFKQFIMIAVTVAVTIAVTMATGGAGLALVPTMLSAAAGAAAGSIAGQLTGKALGVVDKFSWSQVGVSALTAAITAGVGQGLENLSQTHSWAKAASNVLNYSGESNWAIAQSAVANGVLNYTSSYVANQAMGNNVGFSWAGVGGSVAGSYIGGALNGKGVFNRFGEQAGRYASNLVGANSSAYLNDKWFGGGRPDYTAVSMSSIANTAGEQVGDWARNKVSGWRNDPTPLAVYSTESEVNGVDDYYFEGSGGPTSSKEDILNLKKSPYDEYAKYVPTSDIQQINATAQGKDRTLLRQNSERDDYLIGLLGNGEVTYAPRTGKSPLTYSRETTVAANEAFLKIGNGNLPVLIGYGDPNVDSDLTFQSLLDATGEGVSRDTRLKIFEDLRSPKNNGFVDLTSGISETFDHLVRLANSEVKNGSGFMYRPNLAEETFLTHMRDGGAPAFYRKAARQSQALDFAIDVAGLVPLPFTGKAASWISSIYKSRGLGAVGANSAVAASKAAIITERTVLSTSGIDEQVAHAVRMVPGLQVGQARALLQGSFNPNKPVEVVLGGSRIRSFFGQGSFRLDSDLDIGFAAKMKNYQIDDVLNSFDAAGALKSDRGIRIFSGNKPPSGPIASPQEFFQRSGFRGPYPPNRAGEPFGPSGSISFHPNGTITIVPPGVH